MKSYYDMLEVPPSASTDDIKRAFRREIAKYHPDKVQHLGREFQEIASVKAAELTQAYKTLSDAALRADYDALLDGGDEPAPGQSRGPAAGGPSPARPSPPPPPAPDPEPASGPSTIFSQERAGASQLVRRAAVIRFRQVVESEFGSYEERPMAGFDLVAVPKPAFFSLRLPPRVLGRFVDHVDAPALGETWNAAARMKKDAQRDLVVFLMGPSVAPAGELAAAIADQRRRPMNAGGKLHMVPVNTRNWQAHVPADAHPVVKSLVNRLRSA
ncbi:MAG: DnaJ domain-containing protein [Vicinamibacterales bacterium]